MEYESKLSAFIWSQNIISGILTQPYKVFIVKYLNLQIKGSNTSLDILGQIPVTGNKVQKGFSFNDNN